MKKFYVLLVFFVIFCAFTFSFGQWTPSEKEIPVLYNKLFGELKNVYTESSQNGYASKDFLDELQKAVFKQVSFNMTTPSREDILHRLFQDTRLFCRALKRKKVKIPISIFMFLYISKVSVIWSFDFKNLSSELENNYQNISEDIRTRQFDSICSRQSADKTKTYGSCIWIMFLFLRSS